MTIYELYEKLKNVKDVSDDVKQYEKNANVYDYAISCINANYHVDERRIDECLSETDNKYGLYIRMLNCLKAGIGFRNTRSTIALMTLEDKLNQLKILTTDIPACICLREGLNAALKEICQQQYNRNINDNDIEEVKRTVT